MIGANMNKIILPIIAIGILMLTDYASAGLFGPSNFDECILQSMKGVTSDVAASLIAQSCRKKFPDKPKEEKKTRELSDSELAQLTGRKPV